MWKYYICFVNHNNVLSEITSYIIGKNNKDNHKRKMHFLVFTFYQQWQTSHMGICINQIYDNRIKILALIIGLTKAINLSLNTFHEVISSFPLFSKIKINDYKNLVWMLHDYLGKQESRIPPETEKVKKNNWRRKMCTWHYLILVYEHLL